MSYQVLKYGSVTLSAISSQSTEYEFLGDRERTAGGYLRQDISTDMPDARTWKFKTAKMTKAEADALIKLVRQNNYRAQELWIDEFGATTNTVLAYCSITGHDRVPFGLGGQWHDDGCVLTLSFEEALR